MANRDIRTLGTVTAVATTDATIIQPGTVGTAHKYALVSQIISGGLVSSFANVAVTGTAVPTNGFYLPASNTPAIAVNGTAEAQWTSAAYSPFISDGLALGTSLLMWSDVFLASGGVINWNNGNVTITHSAGTLTASGVFAVTDLTVTGTISTARTDSITTAGSNQATATALTGRISVVTSVTAGQGVRLPSADHRVFNRGTIDLTVYPASGVQIEAYGTNVAVEIAPSSDADFLLMSSVLMRVGS